METIQEIQMANWLENWDWAQKLNKILGAEHPRAIRQWNETNEILKQLNQDGKE